jgi:hypothetical protein
VPRKPSNVTLQPDDRLQDSPAQATSMSLPLAVHRRLDVIAELADNVRPTRAEIIGMLIAETELDAAGLEQRLLDYRRKTVREVVPDATDNVIEIEARRPGRPRRRTNG